VTPVVLDASVAVAWFVPDPGTPMAEALLRGERPLFAPGLLLVECANALLRETRHGRAPEGFAARAVALLRGLPRLALCDDDRLLGDAMAIAEAARHPVYDCIYLALARRAGAPLATLDRRLAAVTGRLPIALWSAEAIP
jgi:predicted nucleic acid-binding protein